MSESKSRELRTGLLRFTPERAAALAVVLAPLVYFLPATFGRLVLCPDDCAVFNAPLRVAAANIFMGGSLPLWNPYLFGGMPLLGAAQGGLLFPLNWFFLVFSPAWAANLATLTTYMLAALGAYLYARRAGTSIAGAALTALVWQWSGFMVAQVGHTNVIQTAALLPWTLWAIDGYGLLGERRRGALIAALVALQVFAGHQQTLAYALMVSGAYALFGAVSVRERETRRRYLCAVALLFAGLLVAAVQILPTLELMRHSPRASATYDFFTSFSMPPAFLWALVAPYVVGGGDGALFRAPYVGPAFYGEYIGYVGLLPLALAALALTLRPKGRDYFWAAVALAGLALALGRFLPFDFYQLIYRVPLLNLFRVPARHLLEVDLALAVLAGRGLTALASDRGRMKKMLMTVVVAACLVALAWAAVTLGRPDAFRLGRQAPVTILRAPELFLPLVVAALSAWALLRVARGRRGALALLFVVLIFDLNLWGQTAGWRRGPVRESGLWRETETIRLLREQRANGAGPFRLLSVPQPFDPLTPARTASSVEGKFIPELQPDVYMLHGLENAAGYDGFGLERYLRLAGEMKVWGELPDPRRTLTGASRGFDLLNVRFVVARNLTDKSGAGSQATSGAGVPAAVSYGGQPFAAEDLGAGVLGRGRRLVFDVPNVAADRVALVTNLSWSVELPDKTEVGRVRVRTSDGAVVELPVLAGEHTSEWAYDRPDVRARIRHRRAPVATSFAVEDARAPYEGHTYVSVFTLPRRATVNGVELEAATVANAPDLALDVKRISLVDGERGYPLTRAELTKDAPRLAASEPGGGASEAAQGSASAVAGEGRWRRVAELEDVSIYESTTALPRAWLAPEAVALPDEAALNAIRMGRLPDGRVFDPRRVALVSSPLKLDAATETDAGEATVTRHEPNRVEVSATTSGAAVLVMSENFYPGWRAQVDGRTAELLRVDYNLRGVALTPGRHEVVFTYRPPSVLWGALISLLTVSGLAVWCVGLRGRRTSEKKIDHRASPAAGGGDRM